MMATSEPWITLGRNLDECMALVRDPTREVYVAHEAERPVGFIILNMQGAFAGYIQSVCVAAEARCHGIGTEIVRFAEERIFRDSPNTFLCVSSFNPRAKKLYESLGYRVVGEMPDYIVPGHSEILMRKTIAPILEFRKHKKTR